MEPRLKSSMQWSPFPEELCQQCAEVLDEHFRDEYDLDKAQFVVEGRIYASEILARFGLNQPDQLKQMNFEISMEYDPEKSQALSLIQEAMDAVEYLWRELLEEDLNDQDLSQQWQNLRISKSDYYYRYSTVNSDLERQADALLEQYEKKLVYGEAELEDTTLAPPGQKPHSTIH